MRQTTTDEHVLRRLGLECLQRLDTPRTTAYCVPCWLSVSPSRECWQDQSGAFYVDVIVDVIVRPRGVSCLVAAGMRLVMFPNNKRHPNFNCSEHSDVSHMVLSCGPPVLSSFTKVDDIMRAVKAAYPGARLGIHCHNDQGLAVANSLQAVRSGADVVQVSTKDATDVWLSALPTLLEGWKPTLSRGCTAPIYFNILTFRWPLGQRSSRVTANDTNAAR